MFRRLHPPRREWTYVPSLEVELHARTWADASTDSVPIVLVAGLGVSSRYWVPLGRRLADRYKVYAIDLPGFGRSPKPPDSPWPAGPSPQEQADQLLAWLDARRLERVVLVGHSVGCQIAANFAARFPDRVERLVIAAPTYIKGKRTLANQFPRLVLGALFEKPLLLAVLGLEYGSAGPVRAVQQARRSLCEPIESHLPRIATPTLVIAGSLDPIVPLHWAQTVARTLPNGLLAIIERVGHAVQYSSPVVTARLISDFLDRKIDPSHPPADGTVLASVEDPRRDRHAPPQPISPLVHGVLDYLVAAAALVLPRWMGWRPRTRRVLTAAAMLSTASNLATDHGASIARRLPMVTHANTDLGLGIQLLITTATYLRREPREARAAVLALAAYHLASVALTAKPTGPARYRSANGPEASLAHAPGSPPSNGVSELPR